MCTSLDEALSCEYDALRQVNGSILQYLEDVDDVREYLDDPGGVTKLSIHSLLEWLKDIKAPQIQEKRTLMVCLHASLNTIFGTGSPVRWRNCFMHGSLIAIHRTCKRPHAVHLSVRRCNLCSAEGCDHCRSLKWASC